MKKKIAFIILVLLLLGLCCTSSFYLGRYYAKTHETIETKTKKEVPKSLHNKALIIYSNSNYAWGYHYSGKVVMGDGSIYEFSLELNDNINPSTFNGLTNEFYDKLEKTDREISKKDMDKLYKYLMDFDDDYTKQKNTAMDAGQSTLDFVNYDDEEIYLIKTSGDYTYRNKNDNLHSVLDILKKYGLRVREF